MKYSLYIIGSDTCRSGFPRRRFVLVGVGLLVLGACEHKRQEASKGGGSSLPTLLLYSTPAYRSEPVNRLIAVAWWDGRVIRRGSLPNGGELHFESGELSSQDKLVLQMIASAFHSELVPPDSDLIIDSATIHCIVIVNGNKLEFCASLPHTEENWISATQGWVENATITNAQPCSVGQNWQFEFGAH